MRSRACGRGWAVPDTLIKVDGRIRATSGYWQKAQQDPGGARLEKGRGAFRTWEQAGSIQKKPRDLETQEERRQGIIWASVLVIRAGGKGHCVNPGCSAQSYS